MPSGRSEECEVVVGLLLSSGHVFAQPIESRVQRALSRLQRCNNASDSICSKLLAQRIEALRATRPERQLRPRAAACHCSDGSGDIGRVGTLQHRSNLLGPQDDRVFQKVHPDPPVSQTPHESGLNFMASASVIQEAACNLQNLRKSCLLLAYLDLSMATFYLT